MAYTKQLTHVGEEPIAGNYPMQVQLGMNNVPVLNQGAHGTCTIFACTAAVDAALNKGDYVSQLCQLQLGSYLEKSGYATSGWEGAWGREILSQMELFGIVSKEQQTAHSCAGMLEYPLNENAPAESVMNVEDFHQISERLDNKQLVWSTILDVYQSFTERTDGRKTLYDVKTSLRAGDRLVVGVLLIDLDIGTVGAVGTHKATQDSWVLTPEIALDILLNPSFAGHQMVITGYDDNAVAIDNKGHEHRGLLTLRNSWGDKIGDQGDFYMSYDYFKLLATEVLRIRSASL
ncbi:C1 family peptidase [Legionella tunisiensis]|uniref:C1 family peptidase n=1 Tax=Legionella tunisiensis TaxID=1034944 RepID=UPI00036EF451|nr:C1 family peptidase [Legionella tunisiensis]